MTRLIRDIPISLDSPAQVGFWLIDSPDDHPAWYQYLAILVHLRGAVDGKPPIKYHHSVTHEWLCYALDPIDHAAPTNHRPDADALAGHVLQPANFGYQIIADSDEAARSRIQTALETAPSMDTDFRAAWWDVQFADSHSLLKSFGMPAGPKLT